MDQLFGSLKAFFKPNACIIDNNIFRLHYKLTVIVLIAFSLLVTGRQYIGDPIDCISRDDIPANLLDTFCWIHTTFSVDNAWHKKVGEEVPYPGVDQYQKGDKKTYHAYYQWVCFVLFLQAMLFYVPRYFWKSFEAGRVKHLILGLNTPIIPEEHKTANRRLLVEYFAQNINNHNVYFVIYVIAEMMNFVNVVGQMFLMDRFLGGHFTKYGSDVLSFTEWDWTLRYDPMIRVFPRLTKCTFHRYGPSGDVQTHDSMCILPINIVNEKIYVFLWFWFVILAVLSGLVLVYRALVIALPRMRLVILHSRSRLTNRDYLEVVVDRCKLGDWMMLSLLSKNLDPMNFRDLVAELARRLESNKVLDNP